MLRVCSTPVSCKVVCTTLFLIISLSLPCSQSLKLPNSMIKNAANPVQHTYHNRTKNGSPTSNTSESGSSSLTSISLCTSDDDSSNTEDFNANECNLLAVEPHVGYKKILVSGM